jgi:hypothetical protein
MAYFHLCSVQLAPGSVILPGNWGRIVSRYRQTDPQAGWRVAMEQIFEAARLRVRPQAPGRLTSCFVFDSLDVAMQAAPRMGFVNMLYSVELVDPSAALHRADFDLITRCMTAENTAFMPKAMLAAEMYWSGEVSGAPEILTASSLRIREVVNSEP